jgi:hypothetical protein
MITHAAPASATPPGPLAFQAGAPGEFSFDTGVLRGRLGPPGKGNGLSAVVHGPTGVALDRGPIGHGLFSHYRVFSDHRRYGVGAWDWPKETRLLDDGAVELRWRPEAVRPFEMRAIYRWSAPDALDLVTQITPQTNLTRFEVFLASYFAEPFTNAAVYLKPPEANVPPAFAPADAAHGPWQMFPRDPAAVALISDGRWQLPPNPVEWTLRPFLAAPIVVRRAPASNLAVVLMTAPEDGFAIAMPHQTEGHYSVYLSLGGRDVNAGETVRLRSRLWVATGPTDAQILEQYERWRETGRRSP